MRSKCCFSVHKAVISFLVKLSKRGEYALRALIDFGLAQALGKPLLQVNELASKEDLPVKFLEQILMQLKGAGYLDSRRGKHGGYLLAKPPEDIIIGHVVRLIDGPLAPIACVSQVEVTLRKMRRDKVPLPFAAKPLHTEGAELEVLES